MAILPALANAKSKGDERTLIELLGTIAGLVGSFWQWRADLYEKAVFNQVPDLVYKSHKAGAAMATEAELLSLKAGVARFVAAGAVVGVVWDAVDGLTAAKQEERYLSLAYFARAASGGATVLIALRGAKFLSAPLWLTRVNLVTAVITAALGYAIGKLKGDAWSNWLQAQPFRQSTSKKIIYKSEVEMMQKLADALAEIE